MICEPLGLGAIPALATFWLRRQIAESPRFALAHGNVKEAEQAIQMVVKGRRDGVNGDRMSVHPGKTVSARELFTTRHLLIWLIGAAGTWFLLDFSYYGTTVSTP